MQEQEKLNTDLSTPMDELENKLLNEQNVDELKNIINLFNLNIQRKNIIRTGKMSELQDKIFAQMSERMEKRPGEFSNKDLLDYFKIVQDTITKSDNTIDNIDTPAIQINQQEVNINMGTTEELDRTSKQKVMDAIKSILSNNTMEEDVVEAEFEELPKEESSDDKQTEG